MIRESETSHNGKIKGGTLIMIKKFQSVGYPTFYLHTKQPINNVLAILQLSLLEIRKLILHQKLMKKTTYGREP